jgi:hypothetical protein
VEQILDKWNKVNYNELLTKEKSMLLKPIASKCNIIVSHDGYTMNLKEWADFLKVPYDTLRMRYKRGKRGDDLFQQVRSYEVKNA